MKNNLQESFIHWMELAQRSHQKGDLTIAANLYKEALKIIPNHPDALQLIGIVYCTQQNFTEGVKYLEMALTELPGNPVILTNLANAYYKIKCFDKAIPLLQKSIQLKPDFDEAWHKYANALKALNIIEDAIHAYQKTVELNPNHYNAWYNLGNTLMQTGNYTSAITSYQNAIRIKPDFTMAHNNLAVALMEWDRIDEAEQHYLKAIRLNPNFKDAIKNLSQLYEKAGKDEQANYWRNHLLQIDPDNKALQFYISTRSAVIYDKSEQIDQYQNVLYDYIQKKLSYKPGKIDSYIENNCYPNSELMYQGKICIEIKSLYANFYANIPVSIVTHKNSRCHVGFLVTGGHEGVFLKCMRGILNNIDTNKIDVSIVCSLPNGAKIIAPEITNPSIQFVLLPSDFDIAQQTIVSAKIDILHYWEIGTDSFNYFLALKKPAYRQVASWGWPGTSGLKTVDYFISQKDLEPSDAYQHYTEQLVLMNKMPVYYYRPPVPVNPKPLTNYGLPDKKPLYICQQNLRKVHPDFDTIITGILEKDKEGIVILIKDKHEGITDKIRKRLTMSTGSNSARVIFINRMKEEDYLGLLSQCSVALDTLYYGGGANTIYDTVQAGVPVVTLEGKQHSARFASATFKQMKVTDTIVQSIDEYINTVVELANNKEKRNLIAQKLKENASLIFEDMQAVKELEDFFLLEFEKLNRE